MVLVTLNVDRGRHMDDRQAIGSEFVGEEYERSSMGRTLRNDQFSEVEEYHLGQRA